MDKITVKQAAEKWGVTPRRVQGMCKEGKIPGAERWERTWMIPADAPYPGTKKTGDENMPMPRKTPFLNMSDLYNTPGGAAEAIAALEHNPEAQLLLASEIAHCQGNVDRVYQHAQYILEHRSGMYAVISGGMLLGLCALWKGDIQMWYKARAHMYEAPCKDDIDRDIVSLSLAAFDSEIRAIRGFPDWFAHGCFDELHRDAHPAARVYYIKYLLILAQDAASEKTSVNGIDGMSLIRTLPYLIEPMISQMVVDKVIMAEIYLRLLCCVAYRQSGDDERAGSHLDRAIRLCLADGLYTPLVKYRRQLGLFLDDHLAVIDPDAMKKVKLLHKQYHAGWTKLHNAVLEKNVQVTLSVREREVARLVAFGLSNAEIAARLSLSTHTVISLINSAKNKTGVEARSEFSRYI